MTAIALVLSAALLAQPAEAAPRVRIVSLPDSYAPDLAPGEVLVPGSVYDIVPAARAQAPAPAVPSPSPSAPTSPVPAPAAAVPYSSCYASSYGGSSSYQAPAAVPSTQFIPSYRPPVYSTPMQTTPLIGVPQYAEPVPAARPRRPRFALRGRILADREYYQHRRTEIGFGAGRGVENWDARPFSPFTAARGGGCPGG